MGLAVLGKRECTGNYRRHQFEEESSMEEYLLNKTKDTCDWVDYSNICIIITCI